jgi:hypothetical protein
MDAWTNDDHHVGARGEELRVLAEGLANQPLGPIALHGAADLAGRNDADARRTFIRLGREEEKEVARRDPRSRALHA